MDVTSHYEVWSAASSHFSPRFSQSLTECLLDNSEQNSLVDSSAPEKLIWDDWKEASFGWQVVVPYPKYVTLRHRPRRKCETKPKKEFVKTQPEFHYQNEFSLDNTNKVCPWRESVEPVTYCYLPNNGYYRNNKSGPTKLTREVQEWLAAMQNSKSARSVLARQLHKAAQNSQKTELGDSGTGIKEDVNTKEAEEQDLVSAWKRVHPRFSQKDRTSEVLQLAAKRLQSHVKLTSSGDHMMTYYNPRFAAPETDIHTTCTSGISRKSAELSSHNHLPLPINDKQSLKDVYMPNTTRLAIQTKKLQRCNYEEDLFAFIPMCKQETLLRPLAKLTPKQKQIEDGSSYERGHSPQMHCQGEGVHPNPPDADTPQTPGASLPTEDSCGIKLARSAIARTNLRIEEMRNSPLHSADTRKVKSFFVHKGSGLALLKNGVLRYTVTK